MSEEVDDLFDFNEDLIAAFKDADLSGGKGKPPDGTYEVVVVKAFPERSKQNKPKLSLHMKISNGKYKGRMLFKNYNLDTPIGVKYLAQDLHKCGITLDNPKDLKDHLEDLMGLRLAVVQKTKDNPDWPNTYINQLLAAEDEEGSSEGPADGF